MQDAHGISLLGYAAGIANPRLGKLLDTLLRRRSPHTLGLLACACPSASQDGIGVGTPACAQPPAGSDGQPVAEAALADTAVVREQPHMADAAALRSAALKGFASSTRNTRTGIAAPTASSSSRAWLSSLLTSFGRSRRVHPHAHHRAADLAGACAPALERLHAQRSSCSAIPWDWMSTAGLDEAQAVWSCLELAMLADYPSRIQAVLQGLVSESFTIASGLGVMPAMPILAVKYPRSAAMVVPEAPMCRLHQFYISNLSERDLDPLVAVTARERCPAALEVCAPFQHSPRATEVFIAHAWLCTACLRDNISADVCTFLRASRSMQQQRHRTGRSQHGLGEARISGISAVLLYSSIDKVALRCRLCGRHLRQSSRWWQWRAQTQLSQYWRVSAVGRMPPLWARRACCISSSSTTWI